MSVHNLDDKQKLHCTTSQNKTRSNISVLQCIKCVWWWASRQIQRKTVKTIDPRLNKSHAIQQYDLAICKFLPKIDRVRHFDLGQYGFWTCALKNLLQVNFVLCCVGGLAQVVERSLSMWEVPGSIPGFSKTFRFAENFCNSDVNGTAVQRHS